MEYLWELGNNRQASFKVGLEEALLTQFQNAYSSMKTPS